MALRTLGGRSAVAVRDGLGTAPVRGGLGGAPVRIRVATTVVRLVRPATPLLRHVRLGLRLLRLLGGVCAQLFDWGTAPRAGEGAVEVPSAREAVVHDAGRLSSS
ncbi:hypothetical protein EJC51_15920 [Streptomyces aquilus]|uniref:Uncharacterized protein n=1 Tax=Streptomyces aquilus TaxID=2548456 RepID=A0A3Q9BZL3_9ACTN|nr:hypothetical protein EJC51_15920 [Streptomyces aquilus]